MMVLYVLVYKTLFDQTLLFYSGGIQCESRSNYRLPSLRFLVCIVSPGEYQVGTYVEAISINFYQEILSDMFLMMNSLYSNLLTLDMKTGTEQYHP